MKAPASRLISASASNMAVIGRRAQQRSPGQREVHGVDPPDRRQRELAEHAEGAREARPQGVQGEPGRVGEEGVVLVGLEVLVLHPLELDVVRQVAAGPADLLGAQRLQRPGRRDGHARRPVPAEADRGVPQAVEVQLGVVAGVPVRRRRRPSCGSTAAPAASAGRGPACAGRPRPRTA